MLQGLTSGLRAFCTKSSVVHKTAGLHIRNKTQNQSIQSLLRSPLETDTPVTVQVHTTSISYDKWAIIQESMGILMSIMTRLVHLLLGCQWKGLNADAILKRELLFSYQTVNTTRENSSVVYCSQCQSDDTRTTVPQRLGVLCHDTPVARPLSRSCVFSFLFSFSFFYGH